MGGDWIPTSFVAAEPHILALMRRVTERIDFYRMVAVSRESASILQVQGGKEKLEIPYEDSLIDIFLALKNAGEESAVVVDRVFNQCWITTKEKVPTFLEHYRAIDDWDEPSESLV